MSNIGKELSMPYIYPQAICDLMNYLDSNLVTLNNNLLRTNFDRILHSIWVEVMEEVSVVLKSQEAVGQA